MFARSRPRTVATTVTDRAPIAPGVAPGSARAAPAAAETPGVTSPGCFTATITDW